MQRSAVAGGRRWLLQHLEPLRAEPSEEPAAQGSHCNCRCSITGVCLVCCWQARCGRHTLRPANAEMLMPAAGKCQRGAWLAHQRRPAHPGGCSKLHQLQRQGQVVPRVRLRPAGAAAARDAGGGGPPQPVAGGLGRLELPHAQVLPGSIRVPLACRLLRPLMCHPAGLPDHEPTPCRCPGACRPGKGPPLLHCMSS